MQSNIRNRTPKLEEIQNKSESNQNQIHESNEKQRLDSKFIHKSEFKWFIILCLFLTTTFGTYHSFKVHSQSYPGKPIHQLTRIPSASLLSTQANDLKSLPYFAQKSNFFNRTFVKIGWAWTSFVIWFHSIALASFYFGIKKDQINSSKNQTTSDRIVQNRSHPSNHVPRIITLHLVASLIWVFLTQWFFGSCLIERILILSGAKCMPSINLQSSLDSHSDHQSNVLSSAYCQQRWGKKLSGLDPLTVFTHRPYWSGGIDVSGHTFLLSFSTLIIISALQPSLIHLIQNDPAKEKIPTSYKVAIYSNLGLMILWWWMLLMTSLYFHGPTEKLSGLGLGIGSWFVVESIVNKIIA